MTQSLGEKLRAAREQRGISISEVAEQTRISPLYLEAIDSDNYKTLPGGIFNKGFVRSYAKYVGLDEQEALQDYSRLIAQSEPVAEEEFRSYRPEVLTDDRAASSIVPTLIFAAVILAFMTAGILFLVNYIQNQQSDPGLVSNQGNANAVQPDRAANSNAAAPHGGSPAMGSVKVEFSAAGDEVWLRSVTDGNTSESLIKPGTPVVFEPKQSLDLRYSKSRVQFAQLKLNGKPIVLPAQPRPGQSNIEFTINQGNLAQIWDSGQVGDAPATAGAANTATPAPRATRRATSTPKPGNSNSNSAVSTPPTMTGRPPARPAPTPGADRPGLSVERLN